MSLKAPLLRDIVISLRPKHWLKNAFVLAPVLFAEHYSDPKPWIMALTAFACFCPLSSAMYIVNDLLDRHHDACHPRKMHRPIAAGRIRPSFAIPMALLLILIAFSAAWLIFPRLFTCFMLAYLVNTLVYAFWLKQKVILDVLLIAIGFVLRLEAGCVAISVEPTDWLQVCGFSLALVLGFGKRRAEVAANDVSHQYRPALQSYDAAKLNTILGACTAVCLVAYMLFTVAPETVARHGTDRLVYSVPIVAYGLFRYLFKVMEGSGDGPTEILVADTVFIFTGLLWAAAVVLILVLK